MQQKKLNIALVIKLRLTDIFAVRVTAIMNLIFDKVSDL